LRVCVDTTIFLDILKDEFRDFQDKLYEALVRKEELVSPSVVYGELLPQFKGSTKQIDEFLKEHRVKIESLDIVAVTAAAKSWIKYLTRKGRVKCPNCGQKMVYKAHFLSDFFIGGFASAKCDAILSRDRGIYKKYFPSLVGYENCLAQSYRRG
jgi:predicted nucleic acid-binding protein